MHGKRSKALLIPFLWVVIMTMQVWRQPLLSGVSGTFQTLEAMAALVRADHLRLEVRDVAAALVRGCAGHDFSCEITTVFRFVRDSITFRRDPLLQERVQDSLHTLHFGTGDCDDKSVLLASLLASLGHISQFVVIGQKNLDRYDHVFVEVATSRGWLPLDPTPEWMNEGQEADSILRTSYPIFDNSHESGGPLVAVAWLALIGWSLTR